MQTVDIELKKQQREEAAARNRELLPEVTKIIDEWRKVFPGAKLIYGKDFTTGYEIGKHIEDGKPSVLDMIPRRSI